MTTSKHTILDGKEYDKYFDRPDMETDTLIEKNATVFDTVEAMKKVIEETLYQTKKIAEVLYHKNKYVACKNTFDFVYNHIQYNEDQRGVEEIHSPYRTWYKRKQGIDCDDLTIFIASILINMGIEPILRMVAYKNDYPNIQYQHIYVVVIGNNGKEIILDPVVHNFNYQLSYTYKKDYPMKLNYLRGLGQGEGVTLVTQVAGEGKSATGQVLSDVLKQTSGAVSIAASKGAKVPEWSKITGIALSTGCAAIAQAFGIPAETGKKIGEIINKILIFIVKWFTKERKSPSGWKFDGNNPEHRQWLLYMSDQVMLFNNWYYSWLIVKWKTNARDGASGGPHPNKTPQEFYANFEEFLQRNLVWLTDQDVKCTPNAPYTPIDEHGNGGLSKIDFTDWKNKTGRWSTLLLWYAYHRDRIMIHDAKLFKKLADEANTKKVSFSVVATEFIRNKIMEGGWTFSTDPTKPDNLAEKPEIAKVYLPSFKNPEFLCWLTGTKLGADRDIDYQFSTYTKLMPVRRMPIGQFELDMNNPQHFNLVAFQYDTIMKLPDAKTFKDSAGKPARIGYIADAAARNKTVWYVVAQHIGEGLQMESAANGTVPNLDKWFQDRAVRIANWQKSQGDFQGIKPTIMFKTEEGQTFVWDTGEFPNCDAYAPGQAVWSQIVLQQAAAPPPTSTTSTTPTTPTDTTKPPATTDETAENGEKQGFIDKVKTFVKEKPMTSALIGGGIIVGGYYGAKALSGKKKQPKKGAEIKGLNGDGRRKAPKKIKTVHFKY